MMLSNSTESIKLAIDDFSKSYYKETDKSKLEDPIKNLINASVILFDTEFRKNENLLDNNFFEEIISIYKENKSLLEIRRPEGGIRAWASEPGEAYNAFDGTYGGLWRRIGRAPQDLVGIGFTAQGNFYGHAYERKCFDSKFDWVFEGIKDGKYVLKDSNLQ